MLFSAIGQYHTSSFLKKIHKILHPPFLLQSVKTIFPAKSTSGNFSKLALIGFVFSALIHLSSASHYTIYGLCYIIWINCKKVG